MEYGTMEPNTEEWVQTEAAYNTACRDYYVARVNAAMAKKEVARTRRACQRLEAKLGL